MNYQNFKIFLIVPMIMIFGCKATVETTVSLKDIFNSPSKMIAGDLYIEVPSCSSHQDSRNPSKSLLEAQESVPKIFTGANYIECFSKEFDSFARFNINMALDKDKDGKFSSDNHINIVSNDEVLLAIGLPPMMRDKISKDNSITKSNFIVKIHNDIGRDFQFRVASAFANGKPLVNEIVSLKSGRIGEFKLSDVSVQSAFQYGGAHVLLR